MATRVTLLCAAATASSRTGAFPSPDDPLVEGGYEKARRCRLPAASPDLVLTSPSRAASQTVHALGLDARVEPLLADLDYGEWAGRSLAEVQGASPEALARWMADPTTAPPGGETMDKVVARVGAAIDALEPGLRSVLIVTHAMPIRAAIVHALGMPAAAAMRIDLAPLGRVRLSRHRGWRLQALHPPAR